jgi:folate-binding protein YgfZ
MFLQGLITNDIEALTPDHAIYAALLTPQGRYLADFILVEAGGEILLDIAAEQAAGLRQRLLMYRLRSRVEIDEPELEAPALAVFGDDALERCGLPSAEGVTRQVENAIFLVDPRLAALGARVILKNGSPQPVLEDLGLTLGDPVLYERHRLAIGVPRSGVDLVPTRSLLAESNFEALHGVSFSKGCFIGQELTARMKYRGLTRKRLLPVRIEGAAPLPDTPVTSGGREVGEMRSSHEDLGLALLRLEAVEAARTGAAVLTAGNSRLYPSQPSWLPESHDR